MNVVRPIASLFLAGFVLVASIGVTVNFHLCAGRIQSIALFVKAQPCNMDMTKPCAGKKNDTRRNGCCEEESIVLKGKETNAEVQAVAQIIPSFNLIAVILPVLYTVVDLDVFSAATRYAHYRPPLIERDITVLVQSFLI